jgi:hypothetical protein
MTYVIAGNFNNQNFLMIDSIAEDTNGVFNFAEKLFKLESSETFVALSGNGGIMDYIRLYDDWMTHNYITPNYELTSTIEDIIATAPPNILTDSTRLYFLTHDSLFYYHLTFQNGTPILPILKIDIPQNNYIQCYQNDFTPIQNNTADLYAFSSQEITNYNQISYRQYSYPLHNFKNRFSFVQFNGGIQHIRPYIDLIDFN